MAVITGVSTVLAGHKLQSHLWETLTCGDTGSAFEVPTWARALTVQAFGTFNSETITIQGSNDGTNWFTATDPGGTGITFTAAGGGVCEQMPRYIRPSFSGAAGGDVDVVALARR